MEVTTRWQREENSGQEGDAIMAQSPIDFMTAQKRKPQTKMPKI
jgi:hypothetical protein